MKQWWFRPALVSLLLLVFVWLLIFGNQGLQEMEKLLAIRSELRAEHKVLSERKQKLEFEERQLHHPEQFENIIRQELDYIRDGEVVIKFK